MNAVILAGGFGKRLMPLTQHTPKPMLRVRNRPIIDYCVAQLRRAGIADVVFTLGYLPERVVEWTRGYEFVGCRYAVEQTPLGTFGGVKQTLDLLDDTFVVMSGDGLSDIDIGAMACFHKSSGADVTIAAAQSATPWLFGVIAEKDGVVTEFYEKPSDFRGTLVNTGVYIINKEAMSLLPEGNYDFAKDFFPLLLRQGKIGCYRHAGYWSDIGSVSSYFEANMYALSAGGFLSPPYNRFAARPRFFLPGCDFAANSLSAGNLCRCVVEEDCIIESGVFLNECVVLRGSRVRGSHSRCVIAPDYVLDTSDYALPSPPSGIAARNDVRY